MPKNRYRPTDPLMPKILVRPCPTCGAKIGELCTVIKGTRRITKVEDAHTARFATNKKRLINAVY